MVELKENIGKIIFNKSSDKQPVSTTVDELLKLKQLLDGGVLTEEEFL
ncbi:SHOCT domain-containing protein [Companilactobacillus musae]|nr:SHOCT domain-containing protein [Companilactobacillus musae]